MPSTVIFQKCMATSPKAVRRLVFGEIDMIADPSSGFIDEEESKFYIELFKDFKDGEAKAIANLKASETGRREYARMRNELVRARADQHAVQHVRAHSGEAISGERLAGFMVDVAVSNGWRAKAHYKHWVFKKINHPTKDRTASLARALPEVCIAWPGRLSVDIRSRWNSHPFEANHLRSDQSLSMEPLFH